MIVLLKSLFTFTLASNLSFAGSVTIPPENIDGAAIPDFKGAQDLGNSLLNALLSQDTKASLPLFFPEEPFIALKNIPKSKEYYATLVKEFEHHQASQSQKLKQYKKVEFAKVEKGYCKWKAKNTEYNHIPYWSCYRNQMVLTADGKPLKLPIRTLINWGPNWYVTHLGKP